MTKKAHEVFLPPDNREIRIWRYMDFTAFVAMLDQNGLFFSRVVDLDDPFEGSIPKLWDTPAHKLALQDLGFPPGLDLLTPVRKTIQKQRSWAKVNCWHMNEEESAAMWRLYASSNRAIAVQTTYSKLREAFGDDVYIGVVRYISYDTDNIPFGNLFWPFVHKRKSFEHERELRAMVCDVAKAMSDETAPPAGEWRNVDLSKLVESVYVAPSSPSWFADLVRNVAEKYQLNVPVKQSSLDAQPLY